MTETEVETIDKQKALIDECFNCGGHFFPSLIVNLISENTAKNLDSIVAKTTITNQSLHCPICSDILINIHEQSLPLQLTVFACPNNHGHFFPPGNLISFKKAQKTKLLYHQIWGIPIKSAFAILLPIIFIFTAISFIPISLKYLNERQESRIRANSPTSQPLITPLDSNQTIISFTTKSPSISSLKLNTPTGEQTYPVSETPKTTHTITLKNLQPNFKYSFIISAGNNQTESFSFTLNYLP